MEPLLLVVLVLVVILVGVAAWWLFESRNRSRRLRSRFGPEYDRRVSERGDRRAAEEELAVLSKRRDTLHIVDLSPESRERYVEQWRLLQARFVDEPDASVVAADALVIEIMRERGYPVDDFDVRAEMVAVDHPDVVREFRHAHDIKTRNDQQLASTDDLRKALLHYRALADELLSTKSTNSSRTHTHR